MLCCICIENSKQIQLERSIVNIIAAVVSAFRDSVCVCVCLRVKYKYQANGTGRRRSRKRRPQHCSMCARSLPSYANSIVTASFHFLFGFVAVTRNVDGVKINDCLAPKRGNKELASLIGFCGGNLQTTGFYRPIQATSNVCPHIYFYI